MQQSIRYAAVQDGSGYSLKPIKDDSEAAAVPLSAAVNISNIFRNNAGTFGVQIDLQSVSGDASGDFTINASATDSGGINILPALNGAVASALFTSSNLPSLVYLNIPANFRFLEVAWTGASTSDTFKVYINYNF